MTFLLVAWDGLVISWVTIAGALMSMYIPVVWLASLFLAVLPLVWLAVRREMFSRAVDKAIAAALEADMWHLQPAPLAAARAIGKARGRAPGERQ